MHGKPDIVLPKYKTVIFIHGCFWHGHEGCRYYVVPKTRTEWWLNKINTNINNDLQYGKALELRGWKVLVVWECDLKGVDKAGFLTSIIAALKNNEEKPI
ncbi:hypothetical protein GCM10022210_21180 [Mucilaginibacter dorajii]|uniref:Very short patch repair endonuclease n=2 Tax=Mucilaginibacter dorajii TaxID=692994 RepID=A0ABP7PX84_9SPHI